MDGESVFDRGDPREFEPSLGTLGGRDAIAHGRFVGGLTEAAAYLEVVVERDSVLGLRSRDEVLFELPSVMRSTSSSSRASTEEA